MLWVSYLRSGRGTFGRGVSCVGDARAAWPVRRTGREQHGRSGGYIQRLHMEIEESAPRAVHPVPVDDDLVLSDDGDTAQRGRARDIPLQRHGGG